MTVAATSREDFPTGTESRMAGFMELAGMAIANAQAEQELRELADTQAALRRLAMLVARGEPPEAVFAAVTREGTTYPERVGGPFEGYPPTGLTATVRRTGLPARVDDYHDVPGGERFLREGLQSAVGTPIHVNGRLWGVIAVGSGEGPLPDGTEQRMTEFTDLVATAVSNAESRAELAASRTRIVA